jgi:hypothetical protein
VAVTEVPRGTSLFIVDNSVSGWTGLRYLEEWTGIAKSFDIATGYFELGALLALDTDKPEAEGGPLTTEEPCRPC